MTVQARRIGVLLATVFVIVGSFALPANAAGVTTRPADVVYQTQYRTVNKTYLGEFSGHWKTCAHIVKSPKVVLHPVCTTTVTTGVSVEESGGWNDSDLGAAFGFSVTATVTVAAQTGISADVPANTAGNLQVGVYYNRYSGGAELRSCIVGKNSCTNWSSPAYATVEQKISPAYRFVITSS